MSSFNSKECLICSIKIFFMKCFFNGYLNSPKETILRKVMRFFGFIKSSEIFFWKQMKLMRSGDNLSYLF